jgi:hypothetical protein
VGVLGHPAQYLEGLIWPAPDGVMTISSALLAWERLTGFGVAVC